MPHKTKEQKLRTQTRRQIVLSNDNVQPKTFERPLYKQDPHLEQIAQYTLSDLKKTAVMALFLFGLEFLFFYANLKGVSFIGIK